MNTKEKVVEVELRSMWGQTKVNVIESIDKVVETSRQPIETMSHKCDAIEGIIARDADRILHHYGVSWTHVAIVIRINILPARNVT